jgi:probable FeS assembly SUF system protein SufT
MAITEPITLSRNCEVIQIPSGTRAILPTGTKVRVMQSLGGSYTIATGAGAMYRMDAQDRDLLGLCSGVTETVTHEEVFEPEMIWKQLRTVYDPEIPVNIVDLGLVYSVEVTALEDGKRDIEVRMSMTAPGCGMGNVLKADVEGKLSRLPGVNKVRVNIVFDPAWNPGRMSEAARLQLGIELDFGLPEPRKPLVTFPR